MKKKVVIGFYGATLDRARPGPDRWERWRPTVSMFQHDELLIDRFDLLVDDPANPAVQLVVADIQQISPETEVVLHPIELADFWDLEEVYGTMHDFLARYDWRTETEEYLFHITTGSHITQICTFLLTESRHFPGCLLQTSPPRGRRRQHPGAYSIVDLDLSRYDRLASRFHQEAADHVSFLKAGIETRNRAFNELMERLEKVASRTRDPILLTGPTGAGKSALARRIFDLKRNRNLMQGEFVEVNCATLRGSAAQSTLFGHRKGAFTGAIQDRPGLLRQGDGGLVFLDEIGELGLDEQAMLLRAIEEKTFLPLGADREVSSDFQLICGTNRDLPQEVLAGRFRRDLLARINLWVFEMPGLSERREDIAPNLDFELGRHARRTGDRVSFNREARDAFLAFAESEAATWSGNFRDLGGAVTRMATLAGSGRIKEDDVREEVARLRAAWAPETRSLGGDLPPELEVPDLDPFDRCQLAYVVEVCRRSASLSEAGRTLFSISRQKKKTANDADRVRKYLLRYGLDWNTIRASER